MRRRTRGEDELQDALSLLSFSRFSARATGATLAETGTAKIRATHVPFGRTSSHGDLPFEDVSRSRIDAGTERLCIGRFVDWCERRGKPAIRVVAAAPGQVYRQQRLETRRTNDHERRDV